MEANRDQKRQQARALPHRLPVEKLSALRSLLEVRAEPLAPRLALAPWKKKKSRLRE